MSIEVDPDWWKTLFDEIYLLTDARSVCDARKIELLSETYDRVLIMGNSLGYIQQPKADSEILSEAHRVLRSGGRLLVDVTDGGVVKKSFNPNAWHEIGEDTVVCRQREIQGNIISAREMVINKHDGLIRDRTYAVRRYELQTLEALLQTAGFNHIKIHTNFSPHHSEGDYGFMNRRMFAVGRKS